MQVSFEKLLELLDSSALDNQGVPAAQALVIAFGPGQNEREPISYDSVSDVSMHFDMDKEGHVVSIEFY